MGLPRGRKKREESEALEAIYIEFLYWKEISKTKQLNEVALRWADDNGYANLTKKVFCDKNKISREFPRQCEGKIDFWDRYHDFILNIEKPRLPMALNTLRIKYPAEWYKVVYSGKAQNAFLQKHENKISVEEGQVVLGNAFDIVSPKDNS